MIHKGPSGVSQKIVKIRNKDAVNRYKAVVKAGLPGLEKKLEDVLSREDI